MVFYTNFSLFLDAFLKKRMAALATWKSEVNSACVEKHIFFSFFELYGHFFSRTNGNTSFWARPLKITHGFFSTFFLFFDAFLKKRMAALATWKSESEELNGLKAIVITEL